MNGIQRLQTMLTKPVNLSIYKIYLYLKKREDMYEKYLNTEKNLDEMFEFIKDKAKAKAVNGCAMLEDSVVYGLAIHYFDESNEKLGIKPKTKINKTKQEEKKEDKEKEDLNNDVINDNSQNNEVNEDQISFFGGGEG